MHRCDICGGAGGSSYITAAHASQHVDLKVVEGHDCKDIPFYFASVSSVPYIWDPDPIIDVTAGKYVCDICGEQFHDEDIAKTHVYSHTSYNYTERKENGAVFIGFTSEIRSADWINPKLKEIDFDKVKEEG